MGRSIEQEEEELERKREAQLSYAEKHEKRLIILETFLRGLPTVSLRQSWSLIISIVKVVVEFFINALTSCNIFDNEILVYGSSELQAMEKEYES